MALGNDTQPTSANNNTATGYVPVLKWDPKNIEIRTRSVEMALQPLVMKVRKSVLYIIQKNESEK